MPTLTGGAGVRGRKLELYCIFFQWLYYQLLCIIDIFMAVKDIGTDTWWNDTSVIKPVSKGW